MKIWHFEANTTNRLIVYIFFYFTDSLTVYMYDCMIYIDIFCISMKLGSFSKLGTVCRICVFDTRSSRCRISITIRTICVAGGFKSQPVLKGWKWWCPTIFHVEIWNHPVETTIYLGGGFKYVFDFPPDPWGNDPIWPVRIFLKQVEITNCQVIQRDLFIPKRLRSRFAFEFGSRFHHPKKVNKDNLTACFFHTEMDRIATVDGSEILLTTGAKTL